MMSDDPLESELRRAAQSGDIAAARALVFEKGVDVNTHNADLFGSPLGIAVAGLDEDMVRFLVLEANANVRLSDTGEDPVIHQAAATGSTGMVDVLVNECGADINEVCPNGCTAFLSALWNLSLTDSRAMIEHLVRLGADVEARSRNAAGRDEGSCTLLHSAAWHGYVALMEYLVDELGANLHAETDRGGTVLHMAAADRQWEAVRWLLSRGISIDAPRSSDGGTAMHDACEIGCLDTIYSLTEKFHADMNARDNAGLTPFHRACARGCIFVVGEMVHNCDVDVRAVANDGSYPLDIVVRLFAAVDFQDDDEDEYDAVDDAVAAAYRHEDDFVMFLRTWRENEAAGEAD